MTENLEDIIVEARRQRDEMGAFLDSLSDEAFSRRPGPDRWSPGEHLVHVTLTDPPYIDAMREALQTARSRGQMSNGPFRGRPLGNWFARQMAPPVKRRIKTTRQLQPPPELDRPAVRTEVVRCREALIDVVRSNVGVDFDRATLRSPFLWLLRMPVYSACHVLLNHGARHMWLAREAAGMLAEGEA